MDDTSRLFDVLGDLADEVWEARKKHPLEGLTEPRFKMLAALMEEVGELSKDLLEGSEGWRKEALQVACVAIRLIMEG
jgi:hypothetical protein